jgi:hypothetical protein
MRRFLLVFGLTVSGILNAQNYTRDAGIRVGDYLSASYRIYSEDDQAIEGLLFFGRKGITFTIMKEHFQPALGHISEYLYFTYGYGAHLGFRYLDHYKVLSRTVQYDDYRLTPLLGLDGIIGVEYRFPEFPFMVSLDAKPYFEFSTIQIFSIYLQSVGFSIKYRF